MYHPGLSLYHPGLLWADYSRPGWSLMTSPPNLNRTLLRGEGGSWVLDKLNLEGLNSWTREQQQSARVLLVDSAVFSKSDLDLGKCNTIKHAIKITDPNHSKNAIEGSHPTSMRR